MLKVDTKNIYAQIIFAIIRFNKLKMIHVNVEYFLRRIVTQSQVLHNRTALDKFTSNKSRQPVWNKGNAGLFVGYLNHCLRNKNQSRHFWLSWFHYDPFWRVVALRQSSETVVKTTLDSSSPHDPQIYYVAVRDSRGLTQLWSRAWRVQVCQYLH